MEPLKKFRKVRSDVGHQRRTPEEVQLIVDRIADDMRTGRWLEVTSPHRRLAEELGCTHGYICLLAMRAWVQVRPRLDPEETEQLRLTYRATLERLSVKAEAAGDFKGAAKAIDTASKVAGLYQAGTTIVLTPGGLDNPRAPLEKMAALMRSASRAALAAAVRGSPDEASILQKYDTCISAMVEANGILGEDELDAAIRRPLLPPGEPRDD